MAQPPKIRGRKPKPLTLREAKFARHYIAGKNAREAAELAGYAKSTAEKKGHALLSRPAIRDEINAARADIQQEARYDLLDAVREADTLIFEAREAKQFTAASKILDTKCKLFGLLVDRIQIHDNIDLTVALDRARERVAGPRRGPFINITPPHLEPALALAQPEPDIFL